MLTCETGDQPYSDTFPNSECPLACPWSSLVEGDEGSIGLRGKLLCLWQTLKSYATHAWHHSMHVWLLGQSGCSSPSTKELHGFSVYSMVLLGACEVICLKRCMFVSVVPSLIYLLEISRSPFIYIRKYASGEQHDGPIHQLQFRLFCVHFTV